MAFLGKKVPKATDQDYIELQGGENLKLKWKMV